jgi:cell division protease FtsH
MLSGDQVEKCAKLINECSVVSYDFGVDGIVDIGLPWISLGEVAMIKNLGKILGINLSIYEAVDIDKHVIKELYEMDTNETEYHMGSVFIGKKSGDLIKVVGWMAVCNMVGKPNQDTGISEFDKVIGYAEVKAELMRYADVLKNPSKYNFYGINLPGGILLYCEPGVGKTLLAECFIKESGLKSFTIRKDKPDGDFITYITETFEKASQENGAIVFLDDMDKFANEDEDHRSTEEYVTIQSCIDKYQENNVFVIATVNDFDLLPESITRSGRIDKKYVMHFPEGEDAAKILAGFLKDYKVSEDVDVHNLSRLMCDHSCADYKKVVNEAGIRAVFEGRDYISNEDMVKSFYRILFDSPEKISNMDPEYEKMVAVHEAGHCVIGELLNTGSVTAVSIIRHVNDGGGVTSSYSPSEYPLTIEFCEYRIMRSLGGKAATEIVSGKPDMGCRKDIQGAVDHLGRWIENYCYKGFDVFLHRDQSVGMIERKEKKIMEELERYYQKTKQILIENRAFLDILIAELLDKKMLTNMDIARIKQSVFS